MEEDRVDLMNCPNAKWVVIQILQQPVEKCLKICLLMWAWWRERNRANQGQKVRNMNEILYFYHSYLTELTESFRKV